MDRWEHVSRLYHAVRNRAEDERAAFLSRACVGNDVLRREVESLLRHDKDAENFLERAAFDFAADELMQGHQQSLVGRRLGRYEILSSIGAEEWAKFIEPAIRASSDSVAIKILISGIPGRS